MDTSSENGNVASPQVKSDLLIDMKHIWRTYQMGTEELHALRDVSFQVRRNEYVAIIGPSGSGKSTLMNLIGCLDSPTQGEYWINGQLVSDMTDDELARIRNKEIGFVFQTFNLLARATALHNVELPLIYSGMRAADRHDRAQGALAAVELGDRVMHRRTSFLAASASVAIARALVNHPSILLADEPTGALDSKTSIEIMHLFEKLHEEGNTIILVTHEPDIAARAHRIITIRDGRIESDEKAEMMEAVPAYVSIVFILTTFVSIGFLISAIKFVGTDRLPSQILIFLLPLWIIFTAVLALAGFYQRIDTFPPPVALFAALPAILLIVSYFIFFRSSFVERLPLSHLTLLHTVRIPVELCLLWLSFAGAVPQAMTFERLNFDIVSGILAPVVWLAACRGRRKKRGPLIAYNILGLLLLVNIVTIAVLSLPSAMQRIALDQPNRAVTYFPYIWLPALIVPIVLFSHLAVLWKLARNKLS